THGFLLEQSKARYHGQLRTTIGLEYHAMSTNIDSIDRACAVRKRGWVPAARKGRRMGRADECPLRALHRRDRLCLRRRSGARYRSVLGDSSARPILQPRALGPVHASAPRTEEFTAIPAAA